MSSKSQLLVLAAPSGAGKSTVCRVLMERNPDYRLSVSATTRPPRPGEKDGVHYYFISQEEFTKKIKQNEFIEYEKVHGNYYGTLRSAVLKLVQMGYTVLFDIDVNGALQIKEKFPEAILIFLHPPSLEELKRRLKKRQTDDEAEIEKRLRRLPEEYEKSKLFDYNLVNDKFDQTIEKIEQIVHQHQQS